jgi:hypothetical protein
MRRLQAILAMAALLALPLAPLAWGMACESARGPMLCCPMQGSHSHPGKPMLCHCAGKSQKQMPDVGLIAPIPPATPAAFARLIAPENSRRACSSPLQSSAPGFFSAPFEPPRA